MIVVDARFAIKRVCQARLVILGPRRDGPSHSCDRKRYREYRSSDQAFGPSDPARARVRKVRAFPGVIPA